MLRAAARRDPRRRRRCRHRGGGTDRRRAGPVGDGPTRPNGVPHGVRRRVQLPGRRRGTRPDGDGWRLPHRHHPGLERCLLGVRGRLRLRHRGRAMGLVVRVRRAPPRRLPADPRRRPGALVAPGRGRHVAPSRRAPILDRGSIGPSGGPRHVARRLRVRRVGREAPPDRDGMGVRGPRRPRAEAVPVGRRPRARRGAADERVAGDLPVAQHPGGRLARDEPPSTPSLPTGSGSTT